MSSEQINLYKDDLGKSKIKSDNQFLELIQRHFDLEQLKTKPFYWQDIWIYNSIKYEMKSNRFLKKSLITKYYNEIILPNLKS